MRAGRRSPKSRSRGLVCVVAVLALGCAESRQLEPVKTTALSSIHFARGLRALETNNDKKAAFHFEEAEGLAPKNPRAAFRLATSNYAVSKGRDQHTLGPKWQALAHSGFSRVIELDESFAAAYEGRAYVSLMMEDAESARADFEKACALDTSYLDNFSDATNATRTAKRAAALWTGWIERFPNESVWFYKRGLARIALGERSGALDDFRRAVRLQPTFLLPKLAYAKAVLDSEQVGEGQALLEIAVKSHPGHPALHELIGILKLGQAKLDEAVAAFSRVLELKPNDARCTAVRGKANLVSGNWEAALADFQAAHLLDPYKFLGVPIELPMSIDTVEELRAFRDENRADQLNSAELYVLAHNLAWSRLSTGDEARQLALNLFGRCVSLEPEFALGFLVRGVLLQELGDANAALRDFDRAIELESNLARALNSRGNLYASRGEFENAVTNYGAALVVAPEFAWPARNLGLLDMEDRPQIALMRFSRAIFYDPMFAEAFEDRAWVYEKLGNFPAARVDLALAKQVRGEPIASVNAVEGTNGE